MRSTFPDTYWIIAEISGHKFYPNNDRHYFELIEKAEGSNEPVAKVNGRAWFEGSQSIHAFEQVTGQIFGTGLQVLIQVKVEFHPAHGFALILQDIDSSFTLGNMEKQRRETLLRLLHENSDAIVKQGDEYITRNKSLLLDPVIQHIAIIGSPNSEGYVDFTHTIHNNQYGYTFTIDIYQSSVQGLAAEKELVNKLIDIHASGKKYDCVVMIRGGGSKTDFLVFDTYQLSRAVARFPIPIITGLGHHKDISIVDMMVHTSVKTPTKAAEMIIAHNKHFEEQVMAMRQSVIIRSQQLLAQHLQEINATHLFVMNQSRSLVEGHKEQMQDFKQVVSRKTFNILNSRQGDIAGLLNRLRSGAKMMSIHEQSALNDLKEKLYVLPGKYVNNERKNLEHFQSIVKLMDPKNILKKGFAMVLKRGKIITDPATIRPGDEISIVMDNYEITTEVTATQKTDGTETDL
jgi:exodeoxyribonuclease VII large subunit